jgi:N-acylneuraminate cytidylyltransferase
MKPLCVIPARGGSTRLPGKNLAQIGSRSLVSLAADCAARTCCERIVVSTDDPAIAGVLPCIQRPPSISGPTADISQAVRHALVSCEAVDGVRYDPIITLQPTCPGRTASMIWRMLERMQALHCRSALTGVETVRWRWAWKSGTAWIDWEAEHYPRSQDVRAQYWQEINAVQISSREVVLAGNRWDLPLMIELLPSWAAIDIDDGEDLERARRVHDAIVTALDAEEGREVVVYGLSRDPESGAEREGKYQRGDTCKPSP